MLHPKFLRKIIPLLILILCFFSANSQVKTQVSITGKISNNTFTNVILYQVGRESTQLQSVPVSTEGTFTINQDITIPDFYKLEFDKNNSIMMILKPGEIITLTSDGKDFMKQLSIKGSKETSQVFANQRIIDDTKRQLDSISNLSYLVMANPKRDSLSQIYKAAYDKISLSKKNALTTFMLNNTTSLANLFLHDAFPIDDNINTYMKLDADLIKAYPDNIYVNNLHNEITAATKTLVGSVAPDFTLPDTSGVNFTLSSLKGKYVLIDFWASWCNPCMGEMPNVKKLYADFKDKGLEIVGVSLDKTRSSWTNAIKNKNLSWKMVSDVKFWQSIVVPLYNVSAIPYTVLLDKDGKIIAKNLRGDELYKKVDSILK